MEIRQDRISPNNKMLEVNGKVYKCHFDIVSKMLVKTNFNNSHYQCREVKQEAVIENIKKDFRGYLIFDNCSVNGLPVLDKNYNVIIGNHRAEAMRTMDEAQYQKVQESCKEYFDIDLLFGTMPVRILAEDIDFNEIYGISKESNIDRESTFGEKAINNEAKFNEQIKNLPEYITAETIDDMQVIVAHRLGDSNGLNVFDCNLALLTYMLGDDKEILDCFNGIRSKGLTQANKVRDMLIANAGAIWNLIHDKRLSHIDLRGSIKGAIKSLSFTHSNRSTSDQALLKDLEDFLAMTNDSKNLILNADPDYLNDFVYACIGNSLSKFLEQQNPKGACFEFLQSLADRIVEDNSANLVNPNASVSDIGIYEVLPYFINNGRVAYIQTQLCENFAKLKNLNTKGVKMEKEIVENVAEMPKAEISDEIYYDAFKNLFPTKKKAHYYCDGGHGWLQVSLKDLEALGIAKDISSCSYQQNKFAYLEEDCDMGIYIWAMRAKGYNVDIVWHKPVNISCVRRMSSYRNEDTREKWTVVTERLTDIAKRNVDMAIERQVFEIKDGKISYANGSTEKDFKAMVA